MELCPLSPKDGAYVIMAQTNKLGKFNYPDAYSCSNHIICSFVECYFLQLMKIFVANLIRNSMKNIVEAKEILIRMTNNDQEWAANIKFITLSFCHFLLFSFCLFIYLFYIILVHRRSSWYDKGLDWFILRFCEWMVIIGQWSSKSTFGANNLNSILKL